MFGILVSPVRQDIDRLRQIRDRGTPVVLVDSTSDDKGFSSVSVDDVAGGKLAIQHLIEQGKKKLGFVGSRFDIPQVSNRLRGAQQAAMKNKLQITIFEAENLNVLAGRKVGAEILKLSAKDRPDGIFTANDLLAIGIMQAILMDGSLSIPDDIALVGYDDIEFANTAIVPLTSISQSAEVIGATAVDLLNEIASDESANTKQVVIKPKLVVRASTSQ
jgi:LacI family transcriptional regulator